ncbi:hypothetical protein I553_10830 [Mycobacterium xenopi 4042]|uniref:Uncharacterized protein n=1 Tax=Mycobacterium xenopi 4042 TaxID=1299334 RepID=X8DCQ9_MYCXE|nr:hypothetical protein I553_10830 [Mycobacterium xenopi 4042]
MADIDANTKKAAQLGASMGMHLSADFPPVPTGSDAKSQQIANELNAFLNAARKEIHTYNQSVDAMRAAPAPYPKQSTPPTSPVPTPSTAAQREGHTPYDDICPPQPSAAPGRWMTLAEISRESGLRQDLVSRFVPGMDTPSGSSTAPDTSP